MKKVICILLVLALMLSFSACGVKTDNENMENVSKLQNYYYVGNSDNYYAELRGGKTEKPKVVDGIAGKMVDYVTIRVLPKSCKDGDYKYHIGINEKEYDGTLTKEVIGGYYTVTIDANELEGDYVLTIMYENKSEQITMKSCIKEDMMTWSEARQMAEEELKPELEKMQESGGYEIQIKFIEGETASGQFYWYVSFMNDKKLVACLINPTTKKIVAKRT